jgi:TrmH family RNA methyltransferase
MSDQPKKRFPIKESFKKIAENLYFILTEPESHGNIGATARALKTCGFKNLVLVNPKLDIEHPETMWMAHQSEEIINSAPIVASFNQAIADKRLVIGTTQRKRHFKFPIYTPEEISEKIQEVAQEHPVGLVFGRERTGLTNEELLQCHLHSSILTATTIPALNLAQSVMIYAHTFFRLQNMEDMKYSYDLASQKELDIFYNHLMQSMKKVGFKPRDSMDNFVSRFRRLIGRSMAEKRDIRLLHKLLQIYEEKIALLEQNVADKSTNDYKIY